MVIVTGYFAPQYENSNKTRNEFGVRFLSHDTFMAV